MNTDVAVRADMATAIPAKIQYAKALAQSGLLPEAYRGQPANILWALEYGEALGLLPITAITGVHVIQGKPTASAALISALVRRAGHRLRVTGNDEKAVAEIVRKDDPDFVFRSEWTIDRARKAGLLSKSDGNWAKYPGPMLKHRAVTEVARDACEEALSGVHYTPEELGAEVDAEGEPISAGPAAAVAPVTPDDDQWYVRPPQDTPHIGRVLRQLHTLMTRKGITDRRDKLAICAEIACRDIDSSRDLTDAEIEQIYTTVSEWAPDDVSEAVARAREAGGGADSASPSPSPGGEET